MIAKEVPGLIFKFILTPKKEWQFEFLQCNLGLLAGLGINPGEILADSSVALRFVPPADLERLNATLFESAEKLIPFKWSGEF